MPSFECLYFLDNFYLSILEVKRLDVTESAPASERFLWLRLEKESGAITKLNFRSMDSATDVQERYFEEGFLKFNQTIGTYIEKFNSAQHPLENNGAENLSEETANLISAFLLILPRIA